ncbi:MAG TPA: PilZ domain-containing protein [Candidatus Acidoferrales bacterium]|nr:PilZ domain-containing protein [Candidatus Acidoferrales bacterium]
MTRMANSVADAKPAAKHASKPRRHPRAKPPKDFLVAWQCDGRRDASRAHNVSLGGIFIENPDPPVRGTKLELLFDSPEGEVCVTARVCFVKPRGGMGVQFLGMDFPARRRLYGMLRRLSEKAGR